MRVRLLGPVDVLVDAAVRQVPGLRCKAVLAALALQPGVVVSTDLLIDAVWPQRPPANTRATLHSHMSRLRTILGARDVILARTPGYLLNVGQDGTDIQAARRLIEQASATADLGEREDRLRAAAALWRGQPLADLPGLVWFDDHARRLEHLWLQTRLDLTDTQLALGQHTRLVAELEELAGQHPFHEHIHGQLMLALYRAGRQNEALAAFQRLQHTLHEQLGIDPSPYLRERHTAILRHDPTLDAPAPAPAPVPAPAPATRPVATAPAMSLAVPKQLPADAGGFTGRRRELAHLDSLLPAADGGPARPVAVLISAISGTAGIGKTALAVHWAHRVAPRFPDGQLYVNLRGFDPGGQALDAGTTLRGFLDALGVPAERVPPDLDAQIGLYRSLLAGKRILVVLDNARDTEQVRPLLPAAPGCAAVVTSRHQLTSLTALDNAQPVALDLLSTVDAHQLLARRLGAHRLTAEPDAADEIINRCTGLPLALVITAARAAVRPTFPLAALAAELGDAAAALDGLYGDDPATDIRAVFSWSYHALRPDTARLFRLLGLHLGPDISATAAASLAAAAPDRARTLLTELARANLATEYTPRRYTMHDLLRTYAAEQAHTTDSERDRQAARHRLLDHYLHTAHGARMLLDPHRQPITLTPPQPGVTQERPARRDHAVAWFTTEYPAVHAATKQAAASGFDNHAWQLAWALRTFSHRRGLWPEQLTTDRTALAAARRLGDPFAQARSCFGLAVSYLLPGRLDEADTYFQQALDLYTELGDTAGQAEAHSGLAGTADDRGQHPDALGHAQQALDLLRGTDYQNEYARTLNHLGWTHALLGNYRQTLAYCTEALALLQELGNGPSEANTWDSLGYAHRGLANHAEAITCYQRAIELYHNASDRYNEANSHVGLGDTHRATGDYAAAHAAWKYALDILDDLNHPDADRVRTKLDS